MSRKLPIFVGDDGEDIGDRIDRVDGGIGPSGGTKGTEGTEDGMDEVARGNGLDRVDGTKKTGRKGGVKRRFFEGLSIPSPALTDSYRSIPRPTFAFSSILAV